MTELKIKLNIDPQTNKRDMTISYQSDEDALPMEHEEEHKRLVNSLIQGNIVTVDREKEGGFESQDHEDSEQEKQSVNQ